MWKINSRVLVKENEEKKQNKQKQKEKISLLDAQCAHPSLTLSIELKRIGLFRLAFVPFHETEEGQHKIHHLNTKLLFPSIECIYPFKRYWRVGETEVLFLSLSLSLPLTISSLNLSTTIIFVCRFDYYYNFIYLIFQFHTFSVQM